ncbi:MAG: glutaredoxin 3 [Alphaproteobacteria bacterium]|nr:glutaredoxin 3 [Alphaproteobacteria bacterium]
MSATSATSEAPAKVVVYTTLLCPYCHRAKALLRKKGVAFTEIDVGMDAEKRAEMTTRAHGRHTVPQIFIDGKHVGGCDDLHDLDDQGKLDLLLDEATR